MELDPGGIGKGYAADQAMLVLRWSLLPLRFLCKPELIELKLRRA